MKDEMLILKSKAAAGKAELQTKDKMLCQMDKRVDELAIQFKGSLEALTALQESATCLQTQVEHLDHELDSRA